MIPRAARRARMCSALSSDTDVPIHKLYRNDFLVSANLITIARCLRAVAVGCIRTSPDEQTVTCKTWRQRVGGFGATTSMGRRRLAQGQRGGTRGMLQGTDGKPLFLHLFEARGAYTS